VIARRTGVTLVDGLTGSGVSVCYRYGMLRSRTAAVVAVLAMLALPATSLAQSAGDDQYQDPLGNGGGSTSGHITNTGGGGGGGSSSSGGGSTSSGTPSTSSTVPTASSAGTGSATPTTGEAASGTPKGQLPRTGFDVIVSFELGLAMLLSGLVAHRMLALRERRDS
jgi:hypothetical protein